MDTLCVAGKLVLKEYGKIKVPAAGRGPQLKLKLELSKLLDL